MELSSNVYWVGALDPDLRVFDIIMRSEFGTTYNSYLIKGEKTALIDSVKEGFAKEHIDRIEKLMDLSKLDYLICNHTEPDHSGAAKYILEKAPNVQILGSRAACKFLGEIVNAPVNCRAVEDGEELDLGGKKLKFFHAPFLHWPDTIFTYLIEDQILFPCDVFGSHYCGDCQIFADQPNKLTEDAFKYYYDCIMRPFKEYMLKGLDKIKNLPIKTIAPSHGPILRKDLNSYIDRYTKWSQPPPGGKRAVIVYVTAYGNTRAMAESIAEGLKEENVAVNLHDATKTDMDVLLGEIEAGNILLLGSPTINGDALSPVWNVINSLVTIKLKGKTGAAFGSYGWSGEAVDMLTRRMKDLKFNTVEPGLKFNLVPTKENLDECKKFGKMLAAK